MSTKNQKVGLLDLEKADLSISRTHNVILK